jgi:hypothetical protein
MAASYYLATNSVDVFIFGLLDDGLSITSGQPTLNFYSSESQLISALGTLTGNPNYYYENPYEIPPTNPFDFSSTGDFPNGVTGGTCSSRITSATGPSNVWYLQGNHDNCNGFTATVNQGPFSVTGKCSLYEKYDGSETGVQIFSQTNYVLPSVPSFNNFPGNYSLIEINEGYLYFTGSTYQPIADPTIQGYVVRGDLTNLTPLYNYIAYFSNPLNQTYTGVFYITVMEPYDPALGLSYIHTSNTLSGSPTPYYSTGQEVSIIVYPASSEFPPVSPVDPNNYIGTGRTYLNIQDSSQQYFDLFDDALPLLTGFVGSTGTTGNYITINSIDQEYYGEAYIDSSWGELGPFTRIRLGIPYSNYGQPVTWKIAR